MGYSKSPAAKLSSLVEHGHRGHRDQADGRFNQGHGRDLAAASNKINRYSLLRFGARRSPLVQAFKAAAQQGSRRAPPPVRAPVPG